MATTGNPKKNKTFYRILTVLFVIGFIACAAWLTKYVVDTKRSQEQLDVMKDNYISEVQPESSESAEPSSEEIPETEESSSEPEETGPDRETLLEQYSVPEKEIDFAALQTEQNEDIYAWITIPDTQVDYPILQHPTEMDYYLEYNIDGSKGYPGCIYSQLMNSKDFTDNVTVLYGHNMKNGSMFANLHYYEDSEFFENHPYVYIYTPEEILVYQVFAAYQYHNGHILMYNDVTSEEGMEAYIESIYTQDGLNNQYDKEARPTAQDRILDLSTCISGKADKRWIVSAKLVAEIPAEAETETGAETEAEAEP